MTRLFVTASGTGVGKTFVTALLCRQLRAQGHSVVALKPVISGFDPGQPGDSDTFQLLAAQGLAPTPGNIERVSPWRFAAPLSPDMAAAREGRAIAPDALASWCRQRIGGLEDAVLIEGVGGVMVPLNDRFTVLDWLAALGIPALLVTGSYLGTLSHTLTALAAAQGRGVPLAGVVVSESLDQPAPLAETVATLRRFAGAVPVIPLPRLDAADDWRRAPDLTALARRDRAA
jgi:dethiobiotin synthetase